MRAPPGLRLAPQPRHSRVNDKYNIVYWGGRTTKIWSFHIARARADGASTDLEFDEDLDKHANLAQERLRVLADGQPNFIGPSIEPTFVALRDGALATLEGGIVYLEHSPVDGTRTRTRIVFPTCPRTVEDDEVILRI
ncbi:hypothetical protein FB451DRAFT_1390561 [Mycena latifolia]|nr:hypothetical protein FB451DRAFT_1390561 [Mycena latifolia]